MNPLIQQIKMLDQEILKNQAILNPTKIKINRWLSEHVQVFILLPIAGFSMGLAFSQRWLLKISSIAKFKVFEFIETKVVKFLI